VIPARDCEPGRLYKCSGRREPGPQIFYEFLYDKQVRRLVRRLEQFGAGITIDEFAVILGFQNGHRIAVRLVRGIAGGQRYERRSYCAIPPDYELREIKRPPAYKRAARTENVT
jgi:hypothetical protein